MPSSHCSVEVHVFCATTLPVSVRQLPPDSMPEVQLEGSFGREIQVPLSHWRVSVHVFCA